MVIKRIAKRFSREDDGVSMIEAMLTFPIVFLLLAALIEFGLAVFQWNQAAKASQLGARLAAVSDPLPADISSLTADFSGLDPAAAVPSTVVTLSCGAGATACNATRLNRLVYGSDGTCNAASGTSVPGMCDYFYAVKPEHVRVTYHRAGLGYVGRPKGAVTTIVVELRDLTFTLPFLGALLGFNSMNIPIFPATIVSEDLCTAKSC